ncbi:MMPL family transporter [Anaerobacillus alkaliphilus]|uniref:MMPL family transporter n=1 Tax=Anaerobacillus alkaliphilus TaxID=1548597 RepID=A0A4Q0VWL7_9BACI|nr:MMPL family transporter [Anaerobacillus alkaliphilus]RXJ04117.1 MMPL family transporter [Anaerobacillus alkaliphilus]
MMRNYRWIYLLPILWIVIGVILHLHAPNMEQLVREKGQISVPEGFPSKIKAEMLEEHGGVTGEAVLVVYHHENGLNEEQYQQIKEKISQIGTDLGTAKVQQVITPFDSDEQKDLLVSEDGTTMLVVLMMKMGVTEVTYVRPEIEKATQVEGVSSYLTGSAVIAEDVIISSEEGLAKTEIITVIFVLGILLFVFRSLAAPLVPLITVGASYLVSVPIVAYLIEYMNFPVSNFTQIFIVAVLFGIGTDYCILLLTRFKEELILGKNRVDAMVTTYKAVGATVFYSALTGFIGFFAIGFADFDLYRSAVSVAVGIVVLIIGLWVWVPTAMLLLGEKLFWPARGKLTSSKSWIWNKLGRFSVYKPGWTIVVLALLLIPALLFHRGATSMDTLNEIGNEYDSVMAFEIISEKFSEGQAFPVSVVLENDEEWSNQEWMPYIELVTQELVKIDGVKEVRSATRPKGERMEEFTLPYLLGEVNDGLYEISDGLEEIREALLEIATELTDGQSDMRTAQQDVGKLVDGTRELQEGAEQIQEEMEKVSSGTQQSVAGLAQLNGSISGIANQMLQLTEGSTLPPELAFAITSLADGLAQVGGGITEIQGGLTEIGAGQQQIATATGEIASGIGDLRTGQDEIGGAFGEIEEAFAELAEGLEEIADGIEEIEEGLAEVQDLFEEIANQKANPLSGFFVPQTLFDNGDLDQLWETYTTPNHLVAKFDVILDVYPYSNEAIEVVNVIEERMQIALKGTPLEENRFSIGGLTSVNRDLKTISDEDFNRTAIVMLSGIFIVLVILLRSLIMPLYIMASLIITYIAAISFTEIIYIDLLGHAGLSWAVPFFGFVMLMALGVDYSIFLMGRFTENMRDMPLKEALVSAMGQIGTVILSAAIILAGTFGAMMPSGVMSLMQIATLVLVGLLLYAFFMLPLFIPVMVQLFGDKNWWPFKALK